MMDLALKLCPANTYVYSNIYLAFIKKVVDLEKGGGGEWFMGCHGAWSFFHNFFSRHFWPLPVAVQTI
jgi:hypothetical protein